MGVYRSGGLKKRDRGENITSHGRGLGLQFSGLPPSQFQKRAAKKNVFSRDPVKPGITMGFGECISCI